jgi:hypothetical protein
LSDIAIGIVDSGCPVSWLVKIRSSYPLRTDFVQFERKAIASLFGQRPSSFTLDPRKNFALNFLERITNLALKPQLNLAYVSNIRVPA